MILENSFSVFVWPIWGCLLSWLPPDYFPDSFFYMIFFLPYLNFKLSPSLSIIVRCLTCFLWKLPFCLTCYRWFLVVTRFWGLILLIFCLCLWKSLAISVYCLLIILFLSTFFTRNPSSSILGSFLKGFPFFPPGVSCFS